MKLLFVVNEAGEFVELSRVARKSKEKGHDVAVWVFMCGKALLAWVFMRG